VGWRDHAGKYLQGNPWDGEITLDFPEDIFQRWRHAHAGPHGKAQAVCLTGAVIRILPEYHHAYLVERRVIEGGKNLRAGRIDFFTSLLFAAQKSGQRLHGRSKQGIADVRLPRRLESDLIKFGLIGFDLRVAQAVDLAYAPLARARRCWATRS
jgi:hypothetical protein